MANSQSALKNIRKNRTNYLRNRSISSRLKTLDKVFLSSVESKDKDAASQAAKSLISALDKASKSKLVHSNKVARKKSRCAALLASL
jgi:small subunit ribosomal protein S20